MIKIYSTPTCHYCKQLKEFLKSKDISYEDIDVSKDQAAANEMIEKSGQFGVPVTDIDGKIIIGYDLPEIKKLLKIK